MTQGQFMISRREFLTGTVATLMAGVGTGLYAWQIEPYWAEVVERPLPLPKLPPSLEGRRLIQLSDLHVGPRVSDSYLREQFARVRDLAPDFVVYTGDFVTGSDRRAETLTRLSKVMREAPLGRRATLASFGNHDYGPGWKNVAFADEIERRVADAGLHMLRESAVEIEGLRFVGLDDHWSPRFSRRAARTLLDRPEPTIALVHNPDTADLAIWGEFQGWLLAGHTHGGQIRPPFLPPPVLPVENRLYVAGAYDIAPGRRLYINRGLGHALQVRFNVRPEITSFTLTAA